MENKLLEEFIFNTFDSDAIADANNISDYEADINLFQAMTEASTSKPEEKSEIKSK